MNFDEKDKQIQKKIDWIASQIRETKFELHRQHQELDDALKEQEELRSILHFRNLKHQNTFSH